MKRNKIVPLLLVVCFCMFGCGTVEDHFEEQQALKQEGMELQSNGDYAGAIAKYEEALRLSSMTVGPTEIDLAYYKASAQYRAGDLTGAIDTYSQIIALQEDESSLLGRGLLYVVAKDAENAEKDLNKALNDTEDPLIKGIIYNTVNDTEKAKEYFEKETDSLKTLMNNMIGYTRECYGISNEVPQTVTYEDGSTTLKCSGDLIVKDGKCVAKVKTIKTNFFDSIGLGFLFSRKSEKECRELTTDYATYELGELVPKGVDEDIYWDFLIENTYFDNKFQLQSYFKRVLEATGHDSMDELSETEYEQHYDDIVEIRTRIVNHIKDILESYGEFAQTPDSYSGSSLSTKYWWPIGSTEITEVDGVKMASGDPASVNVSSNFGLRTHPVTGIYKLHTGTDIGAPMGSDFIAANDGIVTYAGWNTAYGMMVIVDHGGGITTLYAHGSEILVNVGDTIYQGHPVLKVGSSGYSTGPHAHFEVRINGQYVEPLDYITSYSLGDKNKKEKIENTVVEIEDTIEE